MRKKYAANHVMIRDDMYYYVRHIPNDLAHCYSVRRLCFSLKTKSLATAVRFAKSVSQRLEDYWFGIRLKNMDVPAMGLVVDETLAHDESPDLLYALDLYLKLKGRGKDKVFVRGAKRNIRYVIKALGNRPIRSYSSSDSGKFRDWLIAKGMSINTVKRVFSTVRSIINITINEDGLDCSNPFSKTFFPENLSKKVRQPLPISVIRDIQKICEEKDDELRWLLALLSDTGMRLGEAVGLLKSDIKISTDIPYLEIKPHQWRTLKTKGSERTIPLIGSSLWACERILNRKDESIFAFPRYTTHSNCNANSASAALNKWLKEQLTNPYQVHGFRHSLRDRLREVECPFDIIDRLGGWHTSGVGQGYGRGYGLEILSKWMKEINL